MDNLNKELIEYLGGLSKCGDQVVGTNHSKVLIPAGMSLESIETMNKKRNRFRGKFATSFIASFSEYVTENTSEDVKSSCFINSENPTARVIFDIGDIEMPLHCEHKAFIELNQTAAYKSMINTTTHQTAQFGTGGKLNQTEFSEFMEDFEHCITLADVDGNDLPVKKAVVSVRKVTIDASMKSQHEINQLSTSKSLMENIAATSEGDPLPCFLYFKCIPYHGLAEREFKIRISIGVKKEDISFNLSIAALEEIQEQMQEEFKSIIIDELPESVDTYIGSFES